MEGDENKAVSHIGSVRILQGLKLPLWGQTSSCSRLSWVEVLHVLVNRDGLKMIETN